MRLLWIWLGVINSAAVFITCFDKRAAKKGLWRVPERALWWIAAAGGGAAMFVAMRLIRHKTRKPAFMLGLPLLTILQIALLFVLWQIGVLSFT